MADLINRFENNCYDDVLIIDTHMHLGKPPGFFSGAYSAKSLIESMDMNNIALGCISSYDSIGQNAAKGNEDIIRLANGYPGRFEGQLGINPNYPGQVDTILSEAKKNNFFTQIKLHPDFHKYPISGEQYHKAYRIADSLSMIVLLHTWGEKDVAQVYEIAREYKNMMIMIGHAGGTLEGIKAAISVTQKTDNTYLDFTLSYNYQGLIEWMVKEAGAYRILFGSDATFNSQSAALGKIIYADITDEDKLKILGQNMKKILEHSKKRRKNQNGK